MIYYGLHIRTECDKIRKPGLFLRVISSVSTKEKIHFSALMYQCINVSTRIDLLSQLFIGQISLRFIEIVLSHKKLYLNF